MNETEILLNLAILNDDPTAINTSTVKLAKELKKSQQTISRKLIELESKGLIKRNITGKVSTITITKEGLAVLKSLHKKLDKAFSGIKELDGAITTGLGEGQYYMSLQGYIEQFSKKLKFKPYPGTLNIAVKEWEAMRLISTLEPIYIEGFQNNERTFGALNCYPIKLEPKSNSNNIPAMDAAIAVPERTHHNKDIIEVIAPVFIREKFNLKDADIIKIFVPSKCIKSE